MRVREIFKLINNTLLCKLKKDPADILFIWGQDIFSFVFGKNWGEAGPIASSFILFYTFRFELDILHNVMAAKGLQKSKFFYFSHRRSCQDWISYPDLFFCKRCDAGNCFLSL